MHFLNKFLASLLISLFLVSTLSQAANPWGPGSQEWEYNPGPNPEEGMQKELVNIYAELPEYMEMSDELMEEQKFRYIFGLMMTRMFTFGKDTTKILFVGQDATHIAEAAKQPGTSGFGARVQSIGNFFGVDQGVATTNAFLSTIKGQYGAFDHFFVEFNSEGEAELKQSSFVDNELWLLANGSQSEIRIQRERFWEWVIKNNPEALKLMVVFGGAARDAFAEFLIARGAKVGTFTDAKRLENIRVPETALKYAGGNNEFPVLVDKNGNDIYEILLGRRLDYSKSKDQTAAIKALKNAGQKAIDMMVFTGGGLKGSGILNPAQLGGYNLEDVEINGKRTNSLQGLTLSDGTVVESVIGFTMSAHPSSLSKMKPSAASKALKKSFERLEDLKSQGWYIEPDLEDNGKPRRNAWHEGEEYDYGRADIRQGYFEFGAPDDRRVSRADASRLNPQTIVIGTRKGAKFDKTLIEEAKRATPSEGKDPKDLWSNRPRQKDTRFEFDLGPGEKIAKAIMTSIDRESLFELKPGYKKIVDKNTGADLSFQEYGIDAYYTKTHPGTGVFGIHRGNFQTAQALILADPHGIDDWITARALTGERGQYLHGLMNDLGFGENYLVIKTVPVGMDGATEEEWEVVKEKTKAYREAALKEAFKNKQIKTIFTDGEIAAAEMSRILKKFNIKMKVVDIQRGNLASHGMIEAGGSGKMADIPRSHLAWWSRIWEGTSGDRVIDAVGKMRGGVRALVTPNWVARQRVLPSPRVKKSINALKAELEKNGLRSDREDIRDFLSRRGLKDGSLNGVGESCVKTFKKLGKYKKAS
ncbi:MAG: hypothetical protein IPM57_05400 [Oligoflexia bacterium]|nr:hypothetical protein [Oligoflexia bacterium]